MYKYLLSPCFVHIECSTNTIRSRATVSCKSQLYTYLKQAYLLVRNSPMLHWLKGTAISLTQNGNNRTGTLIAIEIYCTKIQWALPTWHNELQQNKYLLWCCTCHILPIAMYIMQSTAVHVLKIQAHDFLEGCSERYTTFKPSVHIPTHDQSHFSSKGNAQ